MNTKKKTILFIDEAHTMQGAGGASNGSVDFSNMIKPAITKGTLKVIASTTWEEYYESFEKDRALMRRFYRVSVDEPNHDTTIRILNGLSSRLNDFHEVEITDEAIKAAVESADRYIHDRKNPDKSIDLLDAACAKQRVAENKGAIITKELVFDQVERFTGVPADKMKGDNFDLIHKLESNIKDKLYGQDETVEQVLERVYVSFAGIGNESKPTASFIFLGPTGTGKTELAKLLSKNLDMALLKYDMSEYSERHSVSSLIGPPPGYVGFGDSQVSGGRLINDLSKNPHSIMLFDEVEKAHPDIFNSLLQVLEDGRLTDAQGRVVDFKNTIIIMTTNLGTRDISKSLSLGFANVADAQGTYERMKAKVGDELKTHFRPEFLNRIDDIVVFHQLTEAEIVKIVDLMVAHLDERLKAKDMGIELTTGAKSLLAKRGYDPVLGARPLRRTIQRELEDVLSEKMLFGDLKAGEIILVDVSAETDTATFTFKETAKTAMPDTFEDLTDPASA